MRTKKEEEAHKLELVNTASTSPCEDIVARIPRKVNIEVEKKRVLPDFNGPGSLGELYASKKKRTFLLSESYARLAEAREDHALAARSYNTERCGDTLLFGVPIGEDGTFLNEGDKLHLMSGNFCHDRFCPFCNFRRARKLMAQMLQCLDYLGDNYKYLFLTLTVPNVPADQLREKLNCMRPAAKDLLRGKGFREDYRLVKSIILGYQTSVEVTRNRKTGLYHPHMHIVLVVPKNYAEKGSGDYIPHDRWLQAWRNVMHDQSIMQVHIQTLKALEDDFRKPVAEATKYAFKDSDYLIDGNEALTDQIVGELLAQLKGLRFASYGGVIRQARAALKLQDVEAANADLSDGPIDFRTDLLICMTKWGYGLQSYEELTPIAVMSPDEMAKILSPRLTMSFEDAAELRRKANPAFELLDNDRHLPFIHPFMKSIEKPVRGIVYPLDENLEPINSPFDC